MWRNFLKEVLSLEGAVLPHYVANVFQEQNKHHFLGVCEICCFEVDLQKPQGSVVQFEVPVVALASNRYSGEKMYMNVLEFHGFI